MATPPFTRDGAAHHVQMTSWCRSQSSARRPSATRPGESTLWREKRGTLTPARSARATAGGCCVRRRCARRCSARTPHAPRTPAAHSAQMNLSSLPHPTMTVCLVTAKTMKGIYSWQLSPGNPTCVPAACAWIASLAVTLSLALLYPVKDLC